VRMEAASIGGEGGRNRTTIWGTGGEADRAERAVRGLSPVTQETGYLQLVIPSDPIVYLSMIIRNICYRSEGVKICVAVTQIHNGIIISTWYVPC
jgi:hypothetical protein